MLGVADLPVPDIGAVRFRHRDVGRAGERRRHQPVIQAMHDEDREVLARRLGRTSAIPARTRSRSAPSPSHKARRQSRPGRVKSGAVIFVSRMPTPAPGGMPLASERHAACSAASLRGA
jgi:hypothetical protein